MTLIKSSVILLCGFALCCTAGCNSTTHLTEASAKSMLVAKIKADHRDVYLIPFDTIFPLLAKPTRDDFNSGPLSTTIGQGIFTTTNPAAIVQRLLRAGYVTQSTSSYTVPNVSGSYNAEQIYPKGDLMGRATYAVTISMKDGDPTPSGQYDIRSWSFSGQPGGSAWGPIGGSVESGGTVHIKYTGLGTTGTYNYSQNGDKKTLTGTRPFLVGPTLILIGTGPIGTITVPLYTYTLTSKFVPLPLPNQNQIAAGAVHIDSVSNVLLTSDTEAHAEFAWHVDFNDAAKVLTGKPNAGGKGDIFFGKQPNGDWVITRYGHD